MDTQQGEKPGPIRVMVVDDHDLLRMGLATFLSNYDDLLLVGEARNGKEAVELCHQLQPDVVLMDLMMPVMDGVTATRILAQELPSVRVIVLTSALGDEKKEDILNLGAVGYFTKNVSTETLATAIRDAMP